jgi:hypothetical protein
MRYLITLLVVLSFAASYGYPVAELQSTTAPAEDSFRLSVGTISNFSYGDYPQDIHLDLGGIGPHLGIAYGFSDYFSAGLNLDFLFLRNQYQPFTGDLDLYIKWNYPFPNSPFAISGTLGGLFPLGFYPNIIATFQAGFIYVGVGLHAFMILNEPPLINLGSDIEFSDVLSLLVEIGYQLHNPYTAASLEINL